MIDLKSLEEYQISYQYYERTHFTHPDHPRTYIRTHTHLLTHNDKSSQSHQFEIFLSVTLSVEDFPVYYTMESIKKI